MALMSLQKRNKKTPRLGQETIDRFVISQSKNDAAWEPPTRVERFKLAPLSIPGELAARAAFLAKLHREIGMDKWVERVVRKRVELEEPAFKEAKKNLAS
jgi:hypothetical protein